MEKTALTEFIEYLEGIKERDDIPSHVVTTAKNYLRHEKQQITDSYIEGCRKGFNEFGENSELYFTKTFTNELP
jgi:hypothetical protein